MRWFRLLATLSSLLLPASAIFADDAYHVDFHHALIGRPLPHATFFHKPQSSTNASLLYTVSDKAVLGALNPKDGSVLWRQPLLGQPTLNASSAFLVAGAKDGQIISGHDRTVACWNALTGRLIWEFLSDEGSSIRRVQAVPGTDDVVVLSTPVHAHGHATVSCIAGDGGGLKWVHTDASASHGLAASLGVGGSHVYYITKSHGLLAGGKAKVTTLDSATGHEAGQSSIAVDSEPLGADGHYAAGCDSWPALISTEKPIKNVKVTPLGGSKAVTLSVDDKGDTIDDVTVHYSCQSGAPPHFLLHVHGKSRHWAEVYHVNTKSGDVSLAYSLPATAEKSIFSASTAEGNLFFTRSTESEISLYSSESHGRLGRWSRASFRTSGGGFSPHAAAEVVKRGQDTYAVRVADFSTSGDWSLNRNGELQWTRPEMLAYANIAAWSDNGRPDPLAQDLDLESSVNPLTAYVHRLKRHAVDLMSLPAYVSSLPATLFAASEADAGSRQNLVGTKVVVLGTSQNQLVALDGVNPGTLRWQTDLSSSLPSGIVMKRVTVQEGRVFVYASDGSLTVVNASTGSGIEHKAGSIPASHLVSLPGSPDPSVVKVDDHGVPRPADDLASHRPVEGSFVVTVNPDGEAASWTIGQDVEKLWTLQPPAGMKFRGAIGRADHDPVASIGRVLGDRSVLYKFITPNLALLTATSPSALTMYLIDGVTGAIYHIARHDGVVTDSAIPTVVSENWFAYTFTSRDPTTDGVSSQLVVAELYEAADANDRGELGSRTNYSSFSLDAGTKPHVISQSFSVAEPITHLAVSQTAQGITTRQLLATLADSHAIIGIPREILDPRRPVDRDPTATEREEGLMRYTAALDLDPRFVLTHAREVMGIEHVMASPSLLESTSIVFAFGHDVFGTQTTPSMAFDALGKEFNRVQLSLTVVALALGVVAVRPLVRKKTVDGRWKQ